MFKRASLLTLFLPVLVGLAVSACGATAPEPSEPAGTPVKVAMALRGSIANQGYNAAVYAGLMLIEETYGAETAFSEMLQFADHEEIFHGHINGGAALPPLPQSLRMLDM
jgi:basic membrane lipoprotein Med (substrate-binding protein (PBP1-ABC) superfamily)